MPYIVIAYAIVTLTWQRITGVPPTWTDWFASHVLLVALAILYLVQSRTSASGLLSVPRRTSRSGNP